MTDPFDPSAYGEAFAKAISDEPAMPLDAGRPDRAARPALEALSAEAAGEQAVADRDAFSCCLAAVWLLHGFLDEAHVHCQDVPTASGSYWHGVMHRREGDYSNAKYWFRNVGDHPVLDALDERFGGWDPYDFVDRCADAVRSGAGRDECLDQQQAEWELLFDHCYRAAVG